MNQMNWLQTALNEVAQIWTQADADLRAAISVATNQIDRRLTRNGPNEGESRAGRGRILFQWPLVVLFRVERDGTTITASHGRLMRGRGTPI